ncbi:MAG: homocysteine S-methyltransferase family protein, partial [Acidimicrobiales bacterium]
RAGVGLLLETPTWRASTDWAERLGYCAEDLRRLTETAVRQSRLSRHRYQGSVRDVLISGSIGPRFEPGSEVMSADQAEQYHVAQLAAFASAGIDVATAYTITGVGEAVGIVRAARSVALPVAISFSVEVDGLLGSGASLAEAITEVDRCAPPDYYLLNCAHPIHIERALGEAAPWWDRIRGLRPNASSRSHAELDEADELDEGDPGQLARELAELRSKLPSVTIVGGCCGTDARHVAAFWDAANPPGRTQGAWTQADHRDPKPGEQR